MEELDGHWAKLNCVLDKHAKYLGDLDPLGVRARIDGIRQEVFLAMPHICACTGGCQECLGSGFWTLRRKNEQQSRFGDE